MVALTKDNGEDGSTHARKVLLDGDVELTPVPYGGEMVVPDDEPWDVPSFSAAQVQAIGLLISKQTEDPDFLDRLEDEISAVTVEDDLDPVSSRHAEAEDEANSVSPRQD